MKVSSRVSEFNWLSGLPSGSDRLFTRYTAFKIELLKKLIKDSPEESEKVLATVQELELQLEELSSIINKKKMVGV